MTGAGLLNGRPGRGSNRVNQVLSPNFTGGLTPFHQRVLSHPHASVLIKLLFSTSGSYLNFSREAADPGQGEESLWLFQGKKEDAGYDDVELSALGTSPVTFS